jgi:hypothetical protein
VKANGSYGHSIKITPSPWVPDHLDELGECGHAKDICTDSRLRPLKLVAACVALDMDLPEPAITVMVPGAD